MQLRMRNYWGDFSECFDGGFGSVLATLAALARLAALATLAPLLLD
jgi:hypothetical protein